MATEFASLSLRNDANLQEYYKLENISAEVTTPGNDLTNNGTVTFTSAVFNNGANLATPNTTQYLRTTSTFSIDGGASSIFAWIKRKDSTTGIMFGQANGTSKVAFQIYTSPTQIILERLKAGIVADQVSYSTTLGTSVFHHIGYTYDGTTLKLYLDGVMVNSGSFSGSGSGAITSGFNIGARPDNNGDLTAAIIDDICIFNRELTSAEVSLIYNGPSTTSHFMTGNKYW